MDNWIDNIQPIIHNVLKNQPTSPTISFSTFVNKNLKMVTIITKGTSREKIQLALKERPVKIKNLDFKKYCGSISLKVDPLEMQKKWRNEWE